MINFAQVLTCGVAARHPVGFHASTQPTSLSWRIVEFMQWKKNFSLSRGRGRGRGGERERGREGEGSDREKNGKLGEKRGEGEIGKEKAGL